VQTLKTLAVIAVLSAIGIWCYDKFNAPPPVDPPVEMTGPGGAPPTIELGPDVTPGMSEPPMLKPSGPPPVNLGQNAPPFNPPATTDASPSPSGPAGGVAPRFDGAKLDGAKLDGAISLPSPHDNSPASSFTPTDSPATSADPSVRSFEPPVGAAATSPSRRNFDDAWTQAQNALERNDLSTALLVLSDWYADPALPADAQQELGVLLSQLAGTVIYSSDHYLDAPYEVQANERVEDIAARYHVRSSRGRSSRCCTARSRRSSRSNAAR
jgi:hypothetical protein